MNQTNPEVDDYFRDASLWQQESKALRKIILDCQLTEELKWRIPCYTSQNKNIVLIHLFKEYCGIGFFKGALLKDADHILTKAGENTQTSRVTRFTNIEEIVALEPVLKAYILEAVGVEQSGLKVTLKKTDEYPIPEEFQKQLEALPALRSAFEGLTPGRQRAYLMYFSAAKQSKTRSARVEKYMQQIIEGKGFNDCTCGLSQKLPYCDGSHKSIR